MVLATLPQLSSSSSLYTLLWCSVTSASVCSNQSKQYVGLVPSNLGIFSKALLIWVHCWFSHFSNLFHSSFFCSLSSFILFLSSFCLSMSKHSLSILSCFSHCFCKAARIEELLLPAEGLLEDGYCGK